MPKNFQGQSKKEYQNKSNAAGPKNRPGRRFEHWQVIALYLIIYDIIAVNAAYFLALWFRVDCTYSRIPEE